MWICQAIAWLVYQPNSSSAETPSITMNQLFHSADHLMKAIPERDELEKAVNRLLQAGLLKASATGFVVLGSESFWEQLRADKMSNSELKRRAPSASRPFEWQLSPDAYVDAVLEYKAWFAAELARLRQADQQPRT